MSSSRPAHSSSSSSRTRQSSQARILAQTTLDAELNAEYEESGDSFDYSKLVEAQRSTPSEQQGRSGKVIAYLQHIQRGKLIQPFGCLLALDEKSFRVIAFSENAPEMLTTHQGAGVPAEILSQMYEEDNKEQSEEGLSLLVSRNLLRLMNGNIRHLREAGMSTFILTAELAAAPSAVGQ
ncbi:hypothetical protein SORBI_3001G111366 [Sorghum bicolor]|uniref:PAS fold-2 domain-containing protein n=1 Tax=Sorghum bicolor TaxID=4558 RepID=A0A1Z5S5J4_SORBI|nr:hypothetical protein SORBI_3001G111366 [Sorghum bicolor]